MSGQNLDFAVLALVVGVTLTRPSHGFRSGPAEGLTDLLVRCGWIGVFAESWMFVVGPRDDGQQVLEGLEISFLGCRIYGLLHPVIARDVGGIDGTHPFPALGCAARLLCKP